MFGHQFDPFRQNVGCDCGLISIYRNGPHGQSTRGGPIPLVSVSAFASVVHSVAEVEITQVYVNRENIPIECIYYFPVDSNGAVTHFHAELDGRIIKGLVKENEQAEAQYERAVQQGQTAFLAQENMPDIFKIQIGFLKPGSQVKIVIGYVTEVKNEKGSDTMRFFLPTTVSPRYIPPTETNPKGKDLANMTFSENSPAPLTITVNVALQGEIKSVASPTHQIQVLRNGSVPEKKNWSQVIVSLIGKTTEMDRDFVLLITPAENHKPRLYFEKLEERNSMAIMTHFIPSFKLKETNAELIFVLDRSGSMGGESIALAKRALQMFLHSLPINCYFNIVGFGTSYEFLFPQSVKYGDHSLRHALEYTNILNADLGGTEIFQPLNVIFQKPAIPGYLRQIFLITDGEVSNAEQVISLIKTNSHRNRVFSLGIGNGASHYLVEGVADAGGGTSAFVTYNEKIDSKVIQQLKNSLQPSLTDVEVSWEGVGATFKKINPTINTEKTLFGYGKPLVESEIETCGTQQFLQAPGKVPPIFDGSQMVILGIFINEFPTNVSIKAETPDGPLTIQIPLSTENDVGSAGMLHKLAALKIIRELELEIAALKYSSAFWEHETKEKRMKQKIINIACQNGIASKYTSYVAVDEENKSFGKYWMMQTRHVPSQYSQPQGHSHSYFGSHSSYQQPQAFHFGYRRSCSSVGGLFGSGPSTFRSAPNTFGLAQQQQAAPVHYRDCDSFASQPPTFGGGPPTFGSAAATTFGSAATTTFGSAATTTFGSAATTTFGSAATTTFGSGPFTFGFGPAALGGFLEAQSASVTDAPFRSAPTSFGTSSQREAGVDNMPHASGSSTFSFGHSNLTFGTNSQANNKPHIQLHADNKDVDVLDAIVSLQSYMGFYKLDFALCCILSLELSSLKNKAAENKWDEDVWATALALTYFTVKLPQQKDSWELIYEKAKNWLSINHPKDMSSMLLAAAELIH